MIKISSKSLVIEILNGSQKILQYTKNLDFKSFINDSLTVDAVIWNFTIIGESFNKLRTDFKNDYPEIPWSDIWRNQFPIGQDYDDIDYKEIWININRNIPELISKLKLLKY